MRGGPKRAVVAVFLLAVAGCMTGRPVAVTQPAVPSVAARLDAYRALLTSGTAQPRSIDTVPVTYMDAAGSPVTTPVVRLVFADTVFFDTGSDTPLPASDSVLDRIAANLRADVPATQLTVVGHTDAVGGDAYNLDLSRRRAAGVMAALARRGIDPARLSAVAMGKNQPVASNDTDDGRARNRRVEFDISPDLRANVAAIAAAPEPMALLGPDAAPATTAALFRLDAPGMDIPLTVVTAEATAQPSPPASPPRTVRAAPRTGRIVPVARVRPVTPAPPPNLKPILPDAVAPAPLGPPQTF